MKWSGPVGLRHFLNLYKYKRASQSILKNDVKVGALYVVLDEWQALVLTVTVATLVTILLLSQKL